MVAIAGTAGGERPVAWSQLLESEDLGTTNDAAQWQQSLGHGHLDGLDEALPTHHAMTTGKGLHCCFGTDTNGALKERKKKVIIIIYINNIYINSFLKFVDKSNN